MKKGDRVYFKTFQVPQGATGILVKARQYDNTIVWKVLVSHQGQIGTHLIRENQLVNI